MNHGIIRQFGSQLRISGLDHVKRFAKELHALGIQRYADPIVRDCVANTDSPLQCVSTSMTALSLGGLNAIDPCLYIKAMVNTCILVSQEYGYLTASQAQQYLSRVETAMAVCALSELLDIVHDLDVVTQGASAVRRTAAGGLDKRFRLVRKLLSKQRDALQSAVTATGEAVLSR